MTPPDAPAAPVPSFAAIAMIDDGLRPMRIGMIPEGERDAVQALLADSDVIEDLIARGVDATAADMTPDSAIEALTDPSIPNGTAYTKISDVSSSAARMIERRQMMRQIASSLRNTAGCKVAEFGPDDDLSDIATFDLVFIDYYLDDREVDGTRAERIAMDIQGRRGEAGHQQIVLMSTFESVRTLRTQFRKNASIEASSFAFVAKRDLDEDWKVKAHIDMLARGHRHSAALGDYVSSLKSNVRKAAEELSTTIDDLDIGDYAYIQRIALHADGHPLGDYLSWLMSSHLTALAFEGGLREQQLAVDGMEFEDGPLSPTEPSIEVAKLYHDALFARNLGRLGAHPRAGADSDIADVPLVQLGDVFLTADRTRAVVILSPDCDLAFSTNAERPPHRDLGVIIVFGHPDVVAREPLKPGDASTEGMMAGSEVYRIDWRFSSFRTVPLGELSRFLREAGFDVGNRDRLRPIYALKLQSELGNHLMRVGPPVMPPIARHSGGRIQYRLGAGVTNVPLLAGDVVVSHFKRRSTIRFTPSLVAKLKEACHEAIEEFAEEVRAMPTDTPEAVKALKPMQSRLDGVTDQFGRAALWSGLLGDQALPAQGECKKLKSCIYVAAGIGWTFPVSPAVVLIVGADAALAAEPGDDPTPAPVPDGEAAIVAAAAAATAPEARGAPPPPATKGERSKKGKPARRE